MVGWEVLVLRDSNLALLLDRAPVERMVESTIYDLLDIVAIDDSLVSIWSWSKEIDVADLNLSGSAMLDRAHLRGGASCSRAVRPIHRLRCAQCEWHALRACAGGVRTRHVLKASALLRLVFKKRRAGMTSPKRVGRKYPSWHDSVRNTSRADLYRRGLYSTRVV